MNTKKYNWILYLITATIITTVAVQLYWNYKNFQENRTRVENEVQISLDTAIEEYYSNLSKNNFFSIVSSDSIQFHDHIFGDIFIDSSYEPTDSLEYNVTVGVGKSKQAIRLKGSPSLLDSLRLKESLVSKAFKRGQRKTIEMLPFVYEDSIIRKFIADSTKVAKGIQSVYIALTNDDLNFSRLDSLLNKQLQAKGIETDYYFDYLNYSFTKETTRGKDEKTLANHVKSKSTYLRPMQELRLYYSDPTLAALKKSFTGILLSLLLSLTVIGSLFYLLRIINRQKELAEIKNDLISNITHEFKTPIATVSTAIEAIESFNVIDDKEKTQKYLSMSSLQLKKLHQMVEKLLETATLDSERLILKKEQIDLIDLTSKITKKHELLTNKELTFSSNIDAKLLKVDLFHFENAISNLIDNAIKYGGDHIEINVNSVLNTTIISVADDGSGIEKNQQEKIFDKFYRIPKGNRHDVKGFGIGLYYTKKIIEKHEGKISLQSTPNNTVFKITLPHE
ncbi:sensor histidine kinase [Pseudotenacibaculum haliotis]|uniref:histidine kinase n=1 Tax=Pseudotenacibaculum haliotis TaxID=1862138 RepID=A0ABW5LX52_9FLAO